MSDAPLTAARRAQLQALYPALTPAQVEVVLADEALFRTMGEAVNAIPCGNGELPFAALPPEQE